MIRIDSTAGNTEEIVGLRQQIAQALQVHDHVQITLLQPGIMYQQDGDWRTVIDFMNEWVGKPVSFMSNLVPLTEVKVPFQYSNDMFFAGHKLYQEDEQCINLLSKLKLSLIHI